MSTQKRPKGILKPPSSFPLHADAPLESQQLPPFVPPPAPRIQSLASPAGFDAPKTITPEQHARNRELAIRHATILQHRKDAEALVLTNLEELMDFPTTPPPAATAARPADADIRRFQTLITPFNISDYDELLTERNCADRCAYVFCPVVLKRDRSARANVNRLRYDGSKFHTVKQAMLDRWCSATCARRALYIRVQLSETPAWERAGGMTRPIELLREGDDMLLEEKMRDLQVGNSSTDQDAMMVDGRRQKDDHDDDDKALMQAMEQLALERGDATADSSRRSALMRDSIVEKAVTNRSVVEAPRIDQGGGGGGIEGYEPRIKLDDGGSGGILHCRGANDSDDDSNDEYDDDDNNNNDDRHQQHHDSDWVL